VFTNLEVKGQPTDESRAKRAALEGWVNAVNTDGRWGQLRSAEIKDLNELEEIVG